MPSRSSSRGRSKAVKQKKVVEMAGNENRNFKTGQKKPQAKVKPMKQSVKLISNDSPGDRGRKMERRCQHRLGDAENMFMKQSLSSQSLSQPVASGALKQSAFTPKSDDYVLKSNKYKCKTNLPVHTSPQKEKHANVLNVRPEVVDQKDFVVKLEDISYMLQSECGTKTYRSVSLSRVLAGQEEDEGTSSISRRRTRSCSRSRDKTLSRNWSLENSTLLDKGQRRKMSNRSAKARTDIQCSSSVDRLPLFNLKQGQKSESTLSLRNDLNLSQNNETQDRNEESMSEDDPTENDETDDEDIRTPILVCRLCHAEWTSRFDLHQHMVDFHKVTKSSSAILPVSFPDATANSVNKSSLSKSDEKCKKRRRKKSVGFCVGSREPSEEVSDYSVMEISFNESDESDKELEMSKNNHYHQMKKCKVYQHGKEVIDCHTQGMGETITENLSKTVSVNNYSENRNKNVFDGPSATYSPHSDLNANVKDSSNIPFRTNNASFLHESLEVSCTGNKKAFDTEALNITVVNKTRSSSKKRNQKNTHPVTNVPSPNSSKEVHLSKKNSPKLLQKPNSTNSNEVCKSSSKAKRISTKAVVADTVGISATEEQLDDNLTINDKINASENFSMKTGSKDKKQSVPQSSRSKKPNKKRLPRKCTKLLPEELESCIQAKNSICDANPSASLHGPTDTVNMLILEQEKETYFTNRSIVESDAKSTCAVIKTQEIKKGMSSHHDTKIKEHDSNNLQVDIVNVNSFSNASLKDHSSQDTKCSSKTDPNKVQNSLAASKCNTGINSRECEMNLNKTSPILTKNIKSSRVEETRCAFKKQGLTKKSNERVNVTNGNNSDLNKSLNETRGRKRNKITKHIRSKTSNDPSKIDDSNLERKEKMIGMASNGLRNAKVDKDNDSARGKNLNYKNNADDWDEEECLRTFMEAENLKIDFSKDCSADNDDYVPVNVDSRAILAELEKGYSETHYLLEMLLLLEKIDSEHSENILNTHSESSSRTGTNQVSPGNIRISSINANGCVNDNENSVFCTADVNMSNNLENVVNCEDSDDAVSVDNNLDVERNNKETRTPYSQVVSDVRSPKTCSSINMKKKNAMKVNLNDKLSKEQEQHEELVKNGSLDCKSNNVTDTYDSGQKDTTISEVQSHCEIGTIVFNDENQNCVFSKNTLTAQQIEPETVNESSEKHVVSLPQKIMKKSHNERANAQGDKAEKCKNSQNNPVVFDSDKDEAIDRETGDNLIGNTSDDPSLKAAANLHVNNDRQRWRKNKIDKHVHTLKSLKRTKVFKHTNKKTSTSLKKNSSFQEFEILESTLSQKFEVSEQNNLRKGDNYYKPVEGCRVKDTESNPSSNTDKSIKIRLKRKTKCSVDQVHFPTDAERTPNTTKNFCEKLDSGIVSKDGSELWTSDNNRMSEQKKIDKEFEVKMTEDREENVDIKSMNRLKNKYDTNEYNLGKIPVITLKRIPFFKKLEIDGLRLKFKGTNRRPYWKIKNDVDLTSGREDTASQPEQETSSPRNVINDEALNDNRQLSISDNNKLGSECVDSHQKKDLIKEKTGNEIINKSPAKSPDILQRSSNVDVKKQHLTEQSKQSEKRIEKQSSKRKLPTFSSSKKTKKSKPEFPMTEFAKALLSSGQSRKEKLKQTKRSHSLVRQKSSDSNEPVIEDNRELLFGKSKPSKVAAKEQTPLLLNSKIAQKIVHNDKKEKESKEQELLDIPPATDLGSLSIPPLSLSRAQSVKNSNLAQSSKMSHNDSSKMFRTIENLKQSLESIGSVKNLINNDQKSTRLKDILANDLSSLKNPFGLYNVSGPFDMIDNDNRKRTTEEINVSSPKQRKLLTPSLFDNFFNKSQRNDYLSGNTPSLESSEGKTLSSALSTTKETLFSNIRLNSPSALTDSAFSSPRSTVSSLKPCNTGSDFQGTASSKNKFVTSTPASDKTSSRKRKNVENISQDISSISVEKTFPLISGDKHFSDLTAVDFVDGDSNIMPCEFYHKEQNEVEVPDTEIETGKHSGVLDVFSAEVSGISSNIPSVSLSERQCYETSKSCESKQNENEKSTEKKARLISKEDRSYAQDSNMSDKSDDTTIERLDKSDDTIIERLVLGNIEDVAQKNHQNVDSLVETLSQTSESEVSSLSSQQTESEQFNIPDKKQADITNIRNLNSDILGATYNDKTVSHTNKEDCSSLCSNLSENSSLDTSWQDSETLASSSPYVTLSVTGYQTESGQNDSTAEDAFIQKSNTKLSKPTCDKNSIDCDKTLMSKSKDSPVIEKKCSKSIGKVMTYDNNRTDSDRHVTSELNNSPAVEKNSLKDIGRVKKSNKITDSDRQVTSELESYHPAVVKNSLKDIGRVKKSNNITDSDRQVTSEQESYHPAIEKNSLKDIGRVKKSNNRSDTDGMITSAPEDSQAIEKNSVKDIQMLAEENLSDDGSSDNQELEPADSPAIKKNSLKDIEMLAEDNLSNDSSDNKELEEADSSVSSDVGSDMEEEHKDFDVLSLYASDDASFLDDDEEDIFSATSVKRPESRNAQSDRSSPAGSSSGKRQSSNIDEVQDNPVVEDMDLESPMSPINDANTPSEIPSRDSSAPLHRQLSKDMIPSGYCFYYHTTGKCKNGTKCRYKHDQPSKEVLVKHWKSKMDQALRNEELDRALALFGEITATDSVVPPQVVLGMFTMCRQAGNTAGCHALLKYMNQRGLLSVEHINQFIYMCGNIPLQCSVMLWEVFNMMVNLNIVPANDAMLILLRTFSDCEAWDWIWQVMLYCNEMENFNIPLFCQERALRAMLQDPNKYFNYAVQWLMNANVNTLQRLDKKLLQDICKLCSQSGQTNLSEGMSKMLVSDRHTPRPQTPIVPFEGDNEDDKFEEDEETKLGWLQRIHGVQYSKNWDFLGELFVDRSAIHCPLQSLYIKEITASLKSHQHVDKAYLDFLTCTFKRYKEAFTESADNSAKLDMEGLAVIGNNLLVFCAENKQWETGYQILRAMTHFHLEYLKYCGPYRHIALIAMETCLQFFQPESALQILKETNVNMTDSSRRRFLHVVLPSFFTQLLTKTKYLDCYFILSVTFSGQYKDCQKQDINNSTLKEYTCFLLRECLAKGDIATAVKTFQLYIDFNLPFSIEILMCRSLLVACFEMRYSEMAQNIFELLVRWNVYPHQRLDKPPHQRMDTPRKMIVPLWMTFNEMYLVMTEYMKGLYNKLCDGLLENVQLTPADLYLIVVFTEHLAPSGQQIPFLSGTPLSIPCAQKMVIDILGSRLITSVSALIQHDGSVKLDPVSLERWLIETDKKNRRQGLVFQQTTQARRRIKPLLRNMGFRRNPMQRTAR